LALSSKQLAGSNKSGGAAATTKRRDPSGVGFMSKIIRGPLAIAAVSRKLSVGGATWSVEAADAEARRLRKYGANACNRLLALLRAHHDYGAGELMLKEGRRTPATNRRPAASGPPAPSAL
jgi:hypothetical protein